MPNRLSTACCSSMDAKVPCETMAADHTENALSRLIKRPHTVNGVACIPEHKFGRLQKPSSPTQGKYTKNKSDRTLRNMLLFCCRCAAALLLLAAFLLLFRCSSAPLLCSAAVLSFAFLCSAVILLVFCWSGDSLLCSVARLSYTF